MSDRAVLFGAHGGLVGVISEPDGPTAAQSIAVIVSNIGMHHRVGPFRLYVQLARKLASLGFPVLRFDLSGMGDSAPRHDAPTPAERASLDLQDAMAMLTETLGVNQFILIGLCSGVDSTHLVATRDARVVGAAFVDGYSYPTVGYHVRRYLVRPLQFGRWVRYIQRRANASGEPAEAPPSQVVFARESPTLAQFRADVSTMLQRGVHLLFVMTGGVDGRMNSPRQVFEMLGTARLGPQVTTHAMFEADHIFANTQQRAALLERLTRFVQSVPGRR